MREFDSLGAFGKHLAARAVRTVATFEAASEAIGRLVEKTAKDEIGTYQPPVGPFAGWAELADATKEDRLRQGFTENDPLLRTGDLRDSLTHEASALEAIIGTPDQRMVWLEFGTSKMPPRPVLGPAAFTNKAQIEAILGAAAVSAVFNSPNGIMPVHPALGYDFRTRP